MKMVAIAPTLDIYLPYVCKVSIYRLVWGYCFIHAKAMREAILQDKTNIVPRTLFFYCLFKGTGKHKSAKYENLLIGYS